MLNKDNEADCHTESLSVVILFNCNIYYGPIAELAEKSAVNRYIRRTIHLTVIINCIIHKIKEPIL
jgi:hypothetical protein